MQSLFTYDIHNDIDSTDFSSIEGARHVGTHLKTSLMTLFCVRSRTSVDRVPSRVFDSYRTLRFLLYPTLVSS